MMGVILFLGPPPCWGRKGDRRGSRFRSAWPAWWSRFLRSPSVPIPYFSSWPCLFRSLYSTHQKATSYQIIWKKWRRGSDLLSWHSSYFLIIMRLKPKKR